MSTTAPPPAAAVRRRRFENPRIGDVATILETSAETGGAHTLVEVELAPGGGTPPHLHATYAEHFTVREGELTVEVDGAVHVLGPGDDALAPPRSCHRFANDGERPVVFRVELRPGHAGFERALAATYGLAADGRTDAQSRPRNPLQAAILLDWAEMGLPGRAAILAGPLRVLARVARWRGVDRELERRYL